jgi:hypothetical protein
MNPSRPLALALTLAASLTARAARADDPAAALEHLKEGYALKQAGKCAEAVPHFIESERLAPKPKTLLNLADCEQQLDDLVASQGHALEGRDLARGLGDPTLLGIAEHQLADVDKRLPRLTVRLAPGAPPDTIVSRDGTALGRVSLGAALPANPGKHRVVASAKGRADAGFDVVLVEGAAQVLDVAPGEPVWEPVVMPLAGPEVAGTPVASSWSGRKTVAVTLAGVGVAGLAVGSVFGLEAISQNNASNAGGHCNASGCDGTGTSLRNQAISDATVSTIAFGAGLAAVAAGVIVWVTAPSAAPKVGATGLTVVPALGAGSAGASVLGAW